MKNIEGWVKNASLSLSYFRCEALGTCRTFEWALSCMCSFMYSPCCRSGKLRITMLAREIRFWSRFFRVCSLVSLHGFNSIIIILNIYFTAIKLITFFIINLSFWKTIFHIARTGEPILKNSTHISLFTRMKNLSELPFQGVQFFYVASIRLCLRIAVGRLCRAA